VVIAVLLRRRRVQRQAADRERAPGTCIQTASPFALIGELGEPYDRVDKAAEQVDDPKRRRQGIEAQVTATNQPVAEESLGRCVAPSVTHRAIPRGKTPTPAGSVRRTSVGNAGRSHVDAEIHAAREQVNMLVGRTNALEANHNSSWEAGEAPPEYV
jgi:hypothetical protein